MENANTGCVGEHRRSRLNRREQGTNGLRVVRCKEKENGIVENDARHAN